MHSLIDHCGLFSGRRGALPETGLTKCFKWVICRAIMITLAQFLSRTGVSQAQFAARIGVSQRVVSHWVVGDRTPRRRYMQKIIDATSGAVTPNDFLRAAQVPNEAA